ncbi:MAG: hypothetical protein JO257_16730 [Deltaproteobacteria bacterium]|nr:hypothetical protein [Deltaproteobacteria bacterium]
MKKVALIVACAALAVPARARADDSHDIYSYAWHEHSLKSDVGISALLGGGITGFTDKAMRDTMANDVGGLWDLRVTLGSHIPLALDIGYVGTAATINALGGGKSGTLVGTTAEAAIRYNVLPHFAWNPYAFVGVGWQRYDLSGGTFTVADTGIRDSDNSVVFPMGAGIAYREKHGLVVDVHGTFRASADYGLVAQTVGGSSYVPLHTWAASGAVGYEF